MSSISGEPPSMSSVCTTCCCCGEIENKVLSGTRYVGGYAALASFLALSIIFSFVVSAYIVKAVELTGPINAENMAKWAAAAKWTGVAFGAGIGLAISSKIIDMAIRSGKKRHYVRKTFV